MSVSMPGGDALDWRPKAVVFDCDGLLVDTEPCWTVGETELFRRRGRGFGDAEKALLIGRSLADASVTLAEEFGEQGRERELIEELLVLVREAVAAGARVMPGARELVEFTAGRLPIAVASNSPRALMDVALERGGFAGTFEVSIAADEIASPKPAPDMYLEACRRLGVEPGDALAFEDSSTGVRSARAAGVRCVGVPTLVNHSLEADWVWPSLADPYLVAWAESW